MAEDEFQVQFGREVNDKSYRAPPTLQWTLQPLPLPVHSVANQQIAGHIPSLTSLAMTVISCDLHLFTPASFEGVPPNLIQRVFARARHDRGYDDELPPSVDKLGLELRPDETSLWALETLALLENGQSEIKPHVAILPTTALLHSLNSPFSPIRTLLPSLPLTHCTSLDLSNARDGVNDDSCLTLRYLPSLTVLNMSSTSVGDLGLKMLATSLDIGSDGSKRGPWGLKALYLKRCVRVTDRGIGALARFGGLCVIDLRESSCTDIAITLLNRQVRKLYPSTEVFAPTSPALRGSVPEKRAMFSKYATIEELVDGALQLAGLSSKGRVRLHLRGSEREIPSDQWPVKVSALFKAVQARYPVYRDSGIGIIYGAGAANIPNPTAVAEAARRAEHQERFEVMYGPGCSKRQRRRRKAYDDELHVYNPRFRNAWSGEDAMRSAAPLPDAAQAYRAYLSAGFAVSTSPAAPAPPFLPWSSHIYHTAEDRSRAFVAPPQKSSQLSQTERSAALKACEKIPGSAYLMLSRQVGDEWELPRPRHTLDDIEAVQRRQLEKDIPVRVRKRAAPGIMTDFGGDSEVDVLLGALEARLHTMARPHSRRSSQEQQTHRHDPSHSALTTRSFQSWSPTPMSSSHEYRPVQKLRGRSRRTISPGIVPSSLPPTTKTQPQEAQKLPPMPASSNLTAPRNPFKAEPKVVSPTNVAPLGFESGPSRRKWGAGTGVTGEDRKRRGMVMFSNARQR